MGFQWTSYLQFLESKVTVLEFSVLLYYLCFSSPISTSFHLDLALSFRFCCGELHHTCLKLLQDFSSSCMWVLRKTIWFIAWAMSYWVSVVLWSKVMLPNRHRIQTTPWAIYNFKVYGNYIKKVKIKRWINFDNIFYLIQHIQKFITSISNQYKS